MSMSLYDNARVNGELLTRRFARNPPSDLSDENLQIDPTSIEPAQAVRHLVQQMVGQRLPSERILAGQLKISRPHLRSILALLQKEGLIEARPKSGTYVVDNQTKRLNRIILLIDSDLKLNDDPFISSMVDGLQRCVQDIGARCIIERSNSNSSSGGAEHRVHLEEGVLTLGLAGHNLISGQTADDPPMVGLLLDQRTRPNRRASVFQLEDEEAGREAVRRLLAHNCFKLVFVGREDIPASYQRFVGARDIATQHGIELQFIAGHLSYASGVQLGRVMELPDDRRPFGIIATNDWLALGLRLGLRERHLPFDHNIFVVSFDGLQVTTDPLLGIDSLAVPIAEIAADAVAELQRMHRSPAAMGRVIRYPLV